MISAVTGGTGVVGTPVVRRLIEEGDEVRVLVRSGSAAEWVRSVGGVPIGGDLLDSASLARLTEGADRAFNIAGVNEMCSVDPDLMDRVNIEGTRMVVEACRRSSVGRLVHTSSASAIGERPGEIGDEETVHRGDYLSLYERSKHLSELIAREAEGLDVVIVSPSSVQGPGRATGTAKLIVDVLAGRLSFLTDSRISLIDIDDCARGHVLAASRGRPGERYVLSGHRLTVRGALDIFASVTGEDVDVRYLPAWAVSAGATLVELTARARGRRPIVCREMARVMRAGAWYDGSRAVRELGLEYTPLAETVARTYDWFRSQSLI